MHQAETDKVYHAIADPTRRTILDILAGSERSVKELTAEFSMSQPAISQHLGELKSAKLVAARKVHRENRYRLTARPLRSVITWLDGFRRVVDPAGHQWAIGPVRKGGKS
jgi:DNA-binding transcriptional ArsR family regulator